MAKDLTVHQIQTARGIALFVDVLQFAIFPLMFQGLLSPLNVAVDVVMAIVFARLIGWHWALLPAFFSELVPFLGLVPTWTAAVLIATRGREAAEHGGAASPTVIDVEAKAVPEDAKRLPPPR